MGTKNCQSFQLSSFRSSENISKKLCNSKLFFRGSDKENLYQTSSSVNVLVKSTSFLKPVVFCSSKNATGSVVKSGNPSPLLDASLILKDKSEEIESLLNDRCIYLVGMMGSGKTTIGKTLSKALGYSFQDCDSLIEEAAGRISVADIFKIYGQSFFRDTETEVLRNLSKTKQLVVSTGGGAVVRPINWRYMRSGVSVWLDVPLEALARRVTADGTDSRPLLDQESGDPYSKAMKRLSTIFEERCASYANADARVSLETISAKLGVDVCSITPNMIAIEVLLQMKNFLSLAS